MEKIFEIKLLKNCGINEFEFFEKHSRIPYINKFIVQTLVFPSSNITGDDITGIVYNCHDNLLGYFENRIFSIYMIITFYVTKDEYRHELLEFIKETIDDLEFTGFPVQGTRYFGEDSYRIESDNPLYLPKTETLRNKWRQAYAVIQKMRVESANSDEVEVYVNKLADFRDGIKHKANLEYSEKTISRIIKAGDAGLLNTE